MSRRTRICELDDDILTFGSVDSDLNSPLLNAVIETNNKLREEIESYKKRLDDALRTQEALRKDSNAYKVRVRLPFQFHVGCI